MKKVIVLSGISGSGKSAYIRDVILGKKSGHDDWTNCELVTFEFKGSFLVVSANDYFLNKDNEYKFNPSELPQTHNKCFFDFINALIAGIDLVIVDNTSLSSEEIAPYMLGGTAFDYDTEIVTLQCDPHLALSRNTHGLSAHGIEGQAQRLMNRRLLPWWKNTVVFMD